jgi:hypothetical protein
LLALENEQGDVVAGRFVAHHGSHDRDAACVGLVGCHCLAEPVQAVIYTLWCAFAPILNADLARRHASGMAGS